MVSLIIGFFVKRIYNYEFVQRETLSLGSSDQVFTAP